MKTFLLSLLVTHLVGIVSLRADDNSLAANSPSKQESEVVKTTFLITGLHCPPCAQTVEESLRNIKGVKSAKVDWKSKNAHIEFDEHIVSAQRLSGRIASTAHMMGGDMKYSGWLALAVADIKESDDASWSLLKETLGKVKGVKQVAVYSSKLAIGVQFDVKGELTSADIISAMADKGFKLSNY